MSEAEAREYLGDVNASPQLPITRPSVVLPLIEI
jgi:hypothetical protein